jgi:MCM N-terminal domain
MFAEGGIFYAFQGDEVAPELRPKAQAVADFKEFITKFYPENSQQTFVYRERLMKQPSSLAVDLVHVREFNQELGDVLETRPAEYLPLVRPPPLLLLLLQKGKKGGKNRKKLQRRKYTITECAAGATSTGHMHTRAFVQTGALMYARKHVHHCRCRCSVMSLRLCSLSIPLSLCVYRTV